jgi:hypothetical protein
MDPSAKDPVPNETTLWREIRRVHALIERRIAEQMAAVWRTGRSAETRHVSGRPANPAANQRPAPESSRSNNEGLPA